MASSRPYKLTTKESLSGVVVADDHVKTRLELPPVLPPGRSSGILARVLKEGGFSGDGDTLTRERGGVRAEVDVRTGEVTVSAHGSEDVTVTEDGRGGGGCPCAARTREKVLEGLSERLAKEEDAAKRSLQERVTRRLEGAVAGPGGLGCELERVANRVTSSALKQKAAELGQIKQITQDEQTGSMTIVVEV